MEYEVVRIPGKIFLTRAIWVRVKEFGYRFHETSQEFWILKIFGFSVVALHRTADTPEPSLSMKVALLIVV